MFLRVMIVDDEYLIRNLIRMRLDWEAYGMEIVAEAGSAAKALELASQCRPDIIFTDICMPDMDGIEFSRCVTRQFPDTKIVVISGYDEFKYAQQSLQLGVVDYLLKPIKSEDLKKIAEKLILLVGDEQTRRQEQKRMQELLETNRPILQERFLCGLMLQTGDVQDISEQFVYFDLPLQCDAPMEVAIIDIQPSEYTSEKYKFLMEMQCGGIVKEHAQAIVFSDYGRHIVLLSAYEPERDDMYERLLGALQDAAHCPVTIGVGKSVLGAAQAHISYAQACDALLYRVVAGRNQVIYYEDILPESPSVEREENARIEKLMLYVRTGAAQIVAELLEEIMACNWMSGEQSGEVLQKARTKAMDIVATSQHLATEYKPTSSETFDFLFASTQPEIKAGLSDYLQKLAHAARQSVAEKTDSLAYKAKAYIHDHMAEEDLRLTTVADNLFISAGHLRRLIKKDTGVSFVEYLTDIRIKHASELLRTTSLKGYEVGERVGIHDPHYFSILFKKSTGMSINDFRSGTKDV